jgi:hypothetical protein
VRCGETITLNRAEWAIVRAGQERAKAALSKLQIDVDACEKSRSIERERERKQRELLLKELHAARSPLPWVIVVVVSVAGMAGIVSVALSK